MPLPWAVFDFTDALAPLFESDSDSGLQPAMAQYFGDYKRRFLTKNKAAPEPDLVAVLGLIDTHRYGKTELMKSSLKPHFTGVLGSAFDHINGHHVDRSKFTQNDHAAEFVFCTSRFLCEYQKKTGKKIKCSHFLIYEILCTLQWSTQAEYVVKRKTKKLNAADLRQRLQMPSQRYKQLLYDHANQSANVSKLSKKVLQTIDNFIQVENKEVRKWLHDGDSPDLLDCMTRAEINRRIIAQEIKDDLTDPLDKAHAKQKKRDHIIGGICIGVGYGIDLLCNVGQCAAFALCAAILLPINAAVDC
jgi:hypothetical protein